MLSKVFELLMSYNSPLSLFSFVCVFILTQTFKLFPVRLYINTIQNWLFMNVNFVAVLDCLMSIKHLVIFKLVQLLGTLIPLTNIHTIAEFVLHLILSIDLLWLHCHEYAYSFSSRHRPSLFWKLWFVHLWIILYYNEVNIQ